MTPQQIDQRHDRLVMMAVIAILMAIAIFLTELTFKMSGLTHLILAGIALAFVGVFWMLMRRITQ